MSDTTSTIAIAGAGLAGAKAAETLREEGFAGRVLLLGDEPELPYDRPPLSKDLLRGKTRREAVHLHDAAHYEAQGIELRTAAPVVALDAGRRELELGDGERLRFDRLLLATGAEPRRLPVPGAALDGVHVLRTLADAEALRSRIEAGGRLVVVGAGWIGCEVAASARQGGMDVTIVAPDAVPLERVLGAEVGRVYADLHRERGVELLLGSGVAAIEGTDRVRRVRTTGGRTIDCDAVLVAIGVQPRIDLAAAAGLALGDGIAVDARLQTSAPGIFAAGDVAEHDHPVLGPLRVEHWDTALHQGPAAARAMLGATEPYDRLPYFFSDQYELGMEYSGHAREWDEVALRGDPAAGAFLAFWLKGGRLVAGMNAGIWDVADDIRRLVAAGAGIGELPEVRTAPPATRTA